MKIAVSPSLKEHYPGFEEVQFPPKAGFDVTFVLTTDWSYQYESFHRYLRPWIVDDPGEVEKVLGMLLDGGKRLAIAARKGKSGPNPTRH